MLKLGSKHYYLIESAEDVNSIYPLVESATVVAFDTETTGVNVRKDKVMGFSFSLEEGSGYYLPIYSYKEGELIPHRIPGAKQLLLALSSKATVMHNASFDCRVVKNNFKIDFLPNLLADTMLMMHTVAEEGPFGLKEIAIEKRYELGLDSQEVANQEQEALKQNVLSKGGAWKKDQKDMYMADLEILAEYAIADTDITLRLFNHLEKELQKQELWDFFYYDEVMPLYKHVTIPMEEAGVKLDMPKLERLTEEIKQDIADLEKSVTQAILDSDEGGRFVKVRCLEEVKAKPSGTFAQAVVDYYGLPLEKKENGKYSITKKVLADLPECQAVGFLKGECGLPEEDIPQISLSILKKDGLLNINSKSQLGKLVFEIMEVKPLTTTEKGAPQFNEDFVDHLADQGIVSWAKELKVYNKLVKILGSSFQRFLDEQEDGIFYPYYKQHGTTSGRYSSNLQQLPKPLEEDDTPIDPRITKYTNEIRSLFIAKDGNIFIDDDYASLEPSVFAHDAEDQPLLDIFIKGEDFYSKVAIMALDLKDSSADKKAPNFLKKTHPNKRQDAKDYALGIRYGAEEGKVAQLLKITKEAAADIIASYFKAFPKLKGKMDSYTIQAKKYGYVKSEFGRIRHLPMAKKIYDKYGDAILDYKELYGLAKKFKVGYQDLKGLRRVYKNLLNNALNFPIQSAATTVISRAAVAISKEFAEKNIAGHVCGVIHDQLIIEVAYHQKEQAAEIVQRQMETNIKLKVPLYAIPQFAKNWKEGH